MLVSTTDLLKNPTAECIGKVGVSNPTKFIETVIKNAKSNIFNFYIFSIYQFLLVISKQNINVGNLDAFFQILSENASNNNERLRHICGECLGLLSLMNNSYLKNYIKFLQSSDATIRSTYLYGLKTVFHGGKNLSHELITDLENYLFNGLRDKDLNCKKNAFYSLMGFVHEYSEYVKESFNELFKIFGTEYIIKKELIEETNLGGGIKVKNDKGETIRKSIYTCIKKLLENIPEKFHNPIETLVILRYGLGNNIYIHLFIHIFIHIIINFSR